MRASLVLMSSLVLLTTEAEASAPASPAAKATAPGCCAVLELRQYTLRPGQRDVLIELFDREFVESQEEQGATLVGQFRDTERPDRFVWLRGFTDMRSREEMLKRFYGGPVWKLHREAANATMQDSTNVLLLRPVPGGPTFTTSGVTRPPVGTSERPPSVVHVTLLHRSAPVDDAFLRFVRRRLLPVLAETGATPLALFQSEYAQNTFPALPVREGEHVLVLFTLFPSREHATEHVAKLARSRKWTMEVQPALRALLDAAPETLLLEPTARSLLR
ncbi:NIPSNAP family protein [Myxococcus sp. K15C18031901]|uniref:NIPSNAP family protein n=1 Tax=Myxococcus dinghuensis TaxID=2906761 RepID=UPI0020A746FA|nr:NIPSNAP family protein [Myxococcus dinghuensis]MCP3103807.1 NIPSNAP family protein [Myxococcus dinghuensis]